MFSERSISAVPIIDEDGIVVDMYETVDVMVCCSGSLRIAAYFAFLKTDACPLGRVPEFGSHHLRGAQDALAGLSRCGNLHGFRLPANPTATHQEAACPSAGGRGGRGPS